MNGFLLAMAFLTQIPVPAVHGAGAVRVGRAGAWFPAVGAVIGLVCVAIFVALDAFLPPMLVGGLVVAGEFLLTGGIHMDGLADTADGFGGGWSRERTLEIMRDPAIGACGGAALVLLVLLKAGAIGALASNPGAVRYLLIAPVLGRWSGVLLGGVLPYAGETGSTGSVAASFGPREAVPATVTALAAAAFAFGPGAALLVSVVLGITAVWGLACRRRIGGVTGDALGAAIVSTELGVLLLGAAR